MPYTDLSVHLQILVVLEASGSQESSNLICIVTNCHFTFPVFQKGIPRPLIVAVEFTCGTKPRGSGGAPT